MSRAAHVALAATLTLALGGAGCNPVLGEADQAAEDLELEDGGFDTEDEQPLFGEAAVFEESLDVETDYTDPLETDDEVDTMMNAPDAAIYATAIQWGQMPGDPTNAVARDWTGTIRVNRGAILVRRVIRFEDATDAVEQRTNPLEVSFSSVTRPQNDGLRLLVVDPTPESEEALTLEYELADGTVYSIAMDDMLIEPVVLSVDSDDNRMVAVALRRPLDACEHGFLAGRWHALRAGLGRFIGRVADEDGEVIGHVRGVYGTRKNGEHVFFGKYIALDGGFRGILRGRADDGHFGGIWADRDGEVGSLGGVYRESIPGQEIGGQFLGRWAERRCNLDIDEDLPPSP
jgi:hypothetical protein